MLTWPIHQSCVSSFSYEFNMGPRNRKKYEGVSFCQTAQMSRKGRDDQLRDGGSFYYLAFPISVSMNLSFFLLTKCIEMIHSSLFFVLFLTLITHKHTHTSKLTTITRSQISSYAHPTYHNHSTSNSPGSPMTTYQFIVT